MMLDPDAPRDVRRFEFTHLPEFTADAGLQARVLAARQRRLRARNWRRGGAAAVAAALVAAVIGWAQLATPPAPRDAPVQTDIASGQRESQALEAQWQQLAAGRAAGNAALTRVRIIDANLQAAYDRGGGTRELAPLWQRRNQALRGLIARLRDAEAAAPPAAVTRI